MGEKWHVTKLPKQTPIAIPGSVEGVKGAKKETTKIEHKEFEVIIRKDELMSTVFTRLSPYYAIVGSNGELKLSSGQPPSITIDSEKRAGNKEITKVRGIEVFGIGIGFFFFVPLSLSIPIFFFHSSFFSFLLLSLSFLSFLLLFIDKCETNYI